MKVRPKDKTTNQNETKNTYWVTTNWSLSKREVPYKLLQTRVKINSIDPLPSMFIHHSQFVGFYVTFREISFLMDLVLQ